MSVESRQVGEGSGVTREVCTIHRHGGPNSGTYLAGADVRLRTLLFVPGNRPERVAKAFASGADGVAVDLEDAVAASVKVEARDLAVAALRARGEAQCVSAVRINALDTGLAQDDLEALQPVLAHLDLIVLPKTTSAADVHDVSERLERLERAVGLTGGAVSLLPTIESAAGVLAAEPIAAAHPRVRTLVFGVADLSHELGIAPTAEGLELLSARSHVVLAAAAAGRPGPLDGPYLALDDTDGLSRSAAHARNLGFGGKAVIHPRQLEPVRTAFAPTAADLEWARAVDRAFERAEADGVSSIRLPDGSFVDYPIAQRAREMLAEADKPSKE